MYSGHSQSTMAIPPANWVHVNHLEEYNTVIDALQGELGNADVCRVCSEAVIALEAIWRPPLRYAARTGARRHSMLRLHLFPRLGCRTGECARWIQVR